MILLSNILLGVATVLGAILNVYFWVVVVACVLSWVRPDPYNVIVRTVRTLTEPVYYRIRKHLPFVYQNGMDFSPFIVLIVIQLLDWIVVATLIQYAHTLV